MSPPARGSIVRPRCHTHGMLLLEDGSLIEGPAADVLAVLGRVTYALLRDLTMPPATAASETELVVSRMLDALAHAGYVTRQIDAAG